VSYVFTAISSLCHNIIQNSLTSVDINYFLLAQLILHDIDL